MLPLAPAELHTKSIAMPRNSNLHWSVTLVKLNTVEKQTFLALTMLKLDYVQFYMIMVNNEGLFQNSMRAGDDNL